MTSPWNENLFKVQKQSPLLDQPRAELFHTVVAQGLFLTKRASLTTRVKSPNQDDWDKLVRVMIFLRQSELEVLTLRADGTGDLRWYIDASFAMHPDFRSHTGATMTMGDGAITSISHKQGMNT